MADHDAFAFSSGGVDIFCRLFGAPGKMPVVIVHGLSYFSYDWIEPAAALAVDRQVAAMDMRGFGDSGWAKDYSVPAFAQDIVALLDHLRWEQVVLIGHSMGGRNCTYCAAQHPDRIGGLILADWSPDVAPAGGRRVMETVAGTPDTFATIDAAMAYFKVDPASPDGARKRARFAAYLRPVSGGFAVKRDVHFRNQFRRALESGEQPRQTIDLWATLAKVVCPILVIRGSRSDMFAPETVAKMTASNPRIEVAELHGGHDICGDDPAGFVRAAHVFLSRGG